MNDMSLAEWMSALCPESWRDIVFDNAVVGWPKSLRLALSPQQTIDDGQVCCIVAVQGKRLAGMVPVVISGRHNEVSQGA